MTFGLISLGCDKNRVDSEHILSILTQAGYKYVDVSVADCIVINTCAFIESARTEAVDTILSCAKAYPNATLIVAGCLAEKYAAEIFDTLPEVSAFVGMYDYEKLPQILADCADKATRTVAVGGCNLIEGDRILTTPPHYAYLKIADGCDNRCTYCTIPSIRGRYRSRKAEDIVAEAESLARDGVRELILVAQDVTAYGKDLGNVTLLDLLRLLTETGVEKIRLLYCYPELVTDELIAFVAENARMAKYMDVPIQHISDAVLKRMGRRSSGAQIRALFEKLHKNGIAVRTTVMVGFPGETEEQFEELVRFIEETKPERVGIFAYSLEEGTPSYKLDGRVPKREKTRRVKVLGECVYRNIVARNRSLIGQTVDVLYEDIDYERNLFKGRTEADAPDVDCAVYFKADFVEVGHTYRVKITDTDGYDLIGEVI